MLFNNTFSYIGGDIFGLMGKFVKMSICNILTSQKRDMTELKLVWPVNMAGHRSKIILSPVHFTRSALAVHTSRCTYDTGGIVFRHPDTNMGVTDYSNNTRESAFCVQIIHQSHPFDTGFKYNNEKGSLSAWLSSWLFDTCVYCPQRETVASTALRNTLSTLLDVRSKQSSSVWGGSWLAILHRNTRICFCGAHSSFLSAFVQLALFFTREVRNFLLSCWNDA